jgi:general secretion pathway protein M
MSAPKKKGAWSSVAERWASLALRERLLIGSTAALIFAALLWWIGISPALQKLRQAREVMPQLDAQLQLMRTQASEATTLKAQRALSYDESILNLQNSLKTLGAGASLSVTEARANITLRGVSGDALAQWLAQARSNARLVPSELRLKKNASANPATWDGSVVLSLPAR